jgi:hypothetical protein
MTDLKNLSEEDFETLKTTGLLKKIYPDAPNNFESIKGKRPEVRKDIDIDSIVRNCESILNNMIELDWQDEDNSVYLYEAVMIAVYGDGIFNFINQFGS